MAIAKSIITMSDSYKVGHYLQYPEDTQTVYSYFESRGGRWPETVFFGLQYYLARYLAGPRVFSWAIKQAKELFAVHFGNPSLFNEKAWQHIKEDHGGCLPLSIKAVPEGTVVPNHNVLMTIENTCPLCYWLTNYVETLLVKTWYPCTVATQSREFHKVILGYLELTGDPAGIPFKLHDFGYRGVSSEETAAIGGAAHLLSFLGTDTIAGIEMLKQYYRSDVCGHSIPAAEHSTVTSWGQEHEVNMFRKMLREHPTGLVAVVSDSYNIYNACEHYWGEILRDEVLARDGTLVIRPDSGRPASIVLEVLEILGEKFGVTFNTKGYKVLDAHVRVIQGDGIDFETCQEVMDNMAKHGWSIDNIAFGSGGGLLQKLNRDTQKFAFKCSAAKVSGAWRDVHKDPVTDHGKSSKQGRLKLTRTHTYKGLRRWDTVGIEEAGHDLLVEVFRDGAITKRWSFKEVRESAQCNLEPVEVS